MAFGSVNVPGGHAAQHAATGCDPVTPADIGAAPSSHTHNYAGAASAGGAAKSAAKLATARSIDGVAFDGSAGITHYGVCSASYATAEKAVELPGFSLSKGARVAVKFSYQNTAKNPTLNVNKTGPKPICYADGKVERVNMWSPGIIVEFIFDGANWMMVNPPFETGTSTASGDHSHAEGQDTIASGLGAHTLGNGCVASGAWSFAGGEESEAKYPIAFTFGKKTFATGNQFVIGKYNNKNFPEGNNTLIIGYGTESARANAFRVYTVGAATDVYSGTYHASGADYAELFEWTDGNPDQADRAGRFVTLEGEKIRLAGPDDGFLLGIVSGGPSVVGDVYDDQWQGMFLTDIFGRPVMEEVEVLEELGPDGEVILPAHTERRQKVNPAYDHTQAYVPRTQRPEWDAVGMLGKLVAVGEGGIATASAERTRYRVMARLDESHVRLLIV